MHNISSASQDFIRLKNLRRLNGETPGGRGVLPYMGYIGMCGPKGYGFSAVLVINRVSIIAIYDFAAIVVINRVSTFAL